MLKRDQPNMKKLCIEWASEEMSIVYAADCFIMLCSVITLWSMVMIVVMRSGNVCHISKQYTSMGWTRWRRPGMETMRIMVEDLTSEYAVIYAALHRFLVLVCLFWWHCSFLNLQIILQCSFQGARFFPLCLHVLINAIRTKHRI